MPSPIARCRLSGSAGSNEPTARSIARGSTSMPRAYASTASYRWAREPRDVGEQPLVRRLAQREVEPHLAVAGPPGPRRTPRRWPAAARPGRRRRAAARRRWRRAPRRRARRGPARPERRTPARRPAPSRRASRRRGRRRTCRRASPAISGGSPSGRPSPSIPPASPCSSAPPIAATTRAATGSTSRRQAGSVDVSQPVRRPRAGLRAARRQRGHRVQPQVGQPAGVGHRARLRGASPPGRPPGPPSRRPAWRGPS